MNKDQWKQLTGKAQWDIMVAMRGPDCVHSEPIKWFSTAVLRGIMEEVFRVGGSINRDLKLVVVPNDWPRNHDGWNSSHFFQHITEAAYHLGIPVVGLKRYWDGVESRTFDQWIPIVEEEITKLSQPQIIEYPPKPPTHLLTLLAHIQRSINGGLI